MVIKSWFNIVLNLVLVFDITKVDKNFLVFIGGQIIINLEDRTTFMDCMKLDYIPFVLFKCVINFINLNILKITYY